MIIGHDIYLLGIDYIFIHKLVTSNIFFSPEIDYVMNVERLSTYDNFYIHYAFTQSRCLFFGFARGL